MSRCRTRSRSSRPPSRTRSTSCTAPSQRSATSEEKRLATDVTMPRLSDSMEEGTILKWLVSEGDEVERGQEIVEIETDKANMTYESDSSGTVLELVASEGDTIALGEPIARIGDPSESNGAGAPKEEKQEEEERGEEESGEE